MTLRTVTTPVLEIAFEESGDQDGSPVVLLHGFPYDVHSYDEVAALLADRGARVIVPHLRGYGPTRFLDAATMRSGQQAALGQDLLELLDALGIERAAVGGYDWGGRAACVLAALRPERVTGMVTVEGYNIQDIAHALEPEEPHREQAQWYQYYFQTENGRAGLEQNRRGIAEILWRDWSPMWTGAASAFQRSAPNLDNPDFVDVVIHSYRHRRQNAVGDPRYDDAEARLAEQPAITVPTVHLHPMADGLGASDPEADEPKFTGGYELRRLDGIGHNPPQEAPNAFADAVLSLL